MNDLPPPPENDSTSDLPKEDSLDRNMLRLRSDELMRKAFEDLRKECEDYEKEHGKPMPPPKVW